MSKPSRNQAYSLCGKSVVKFVWKEVKEDKLGFQSAAVAFYFLMALVPALAVVAGIYGVVADPGDVVNQLKQLEGLIPQDAYLLLETELSKLAEGRTSPGFSVVFGILLALWGSSKGVTALMAALNIVYNEQETRSWIRRKLLVLAVSAGGAVLMAAMVGLLGALPTILKIASLGIVSETLLSVLRWPVIFMIAVLALSLGYHIIPCHRKRHWYWITPGGLVAALLWVPASLGLTFYGGEVGNLSASYGSLAAVILLMLWFYVTVFVVLLGGKLNAVVEREASALHLS